MRQENIAPEEVGGAGMLERPRYLFAASAPIAATTFEKTFVALADTVEDRDIDVLDSNQALVQAVKCRWPESRVISAPKTSSASAVRSLLSKVQRLVLYWDGEDMSRLLFEARAKKIPTKLLAVAVTRIVNKKITKDFDVYIGRGTPWGNPFAISHSDDGPDRADVIEKYKEYFYQKIDTDPVFRKGILGLRGLRLACFCKPEACHGDVIAKYLDEATDDG